MQHRGRSNAAWGSGCILRSLWLGCTQASLRRYCWGGSRLDVTIELSSALGTTCGCTIISV